MKNRLGIIGGGQLGRMLTQEAISLGFSVTVIDATPNCPAAQVGAIQIVAALTDRAAIRKLASQVDFMTYEIEHIATDVLKDLSNKGKKINPSPKTLEIINDKLKQKQFLAKYNIPIAEFVEIKSAANVATVGARFGYPFLLKNRFGAYDGRGNAKILSARSIVPALEKLGAENLYAERFVPFTKELAVIAVRNLSGKIKTYDVVETVHQNNICHTVLAPANITKAQAQKAKALAIEVMQVLRGAGVFGIEMFLTRSGKILINEIAPRVHNSGHLTLEACQTSQFSQQIRATTGLPLGETTMIYPAAMMINILGDRLGSAKLTGLAKVLQIPGVSVHIYGKAETKPERKMGHITAVGKNQTEVTKKARRARSLISI